MEKAFNELALIKELKNRNSKLLNDLEMIYLQTKEILNNRISVVFNTYTLHDINHSNRIMEYMYNIIDDISRIDDLEIAVLCYSAMLHDVGMAVWDDEIVNIKSNVYVSPHGNFSAYLKYYEDEKTALQEFVRNIHAERSAQYIKTNLRQSLHLPNQPTNSFNETVALICQSHTESVDWIQKKLPNHTVKGDYSFNPQYCACLLRIGDILDIDTQRTPYKLYELLSLKGISNSEWQQHFVVSNNNKISIDPKNHNKKIVFHGTCDNPSIHRKILQYLEWVQKELLDCIALTSKMDQKYVINFNPIVENSIESKNYTFSSNKMSLNFKAISNLLMGKNIYGTETLGLRELVQNSIDACAVRSEETKRNYSIGDDLYSPKIRIIINENKNEIILKDNGIGMSIDTIKNYFLSIGTSYYSSKDFKIKNYGYQPIGNYGIGFLSCFMLSPTVKVNTRFYTSNYKYTVELEKDSEYTSISEKDDILFEGTEIILEYKSFMSIFNNNPKNIQEFIEEYFLTDELTVEIINTKESKIDKINNTLSLITELEKKQILIDISPYLNGINGNIIISFKDKFIRNLHDLVNDTTYIYNSNEEFVEVDKSFNLKDYVYDNKINYMTIPIIGSDISDEYQQALKYYDNDHERAIDRMGNDIETINIILTDIQHSTASKNILYGNNLIFSSLYFYKLDVLGHDVSCPTYIKTGSVNVYHLPDIQEMIEYNDDKRYIANNLFHFMNERKVYLRKVLIKNFAIHMPYNLEIFKLDAYKLNISSNKVWPDISRNNINHEIEPQLNYAISKAIYYSLLNKVTFTTDQYNLLSSFIEKYFSRTTIFEK